MLIYTSYREKEACSALRDIARVNGRSEDIDVVAMGNKEKRYMFLWYNDPTDITRRGFGQIKVEKNSVMDIFKPITLPYTLAFMFGSITIGLFTALSCIGEVVAPLAIDYAPYKLRNQDTAFFAMGFVALVGEKQIHNIFSLFTDSSQELASAITSRRCSTALCPRRWRTWSGKLRGIKSSFFKFQLSRSFLYSKPGCCSFVEYDLGQRNPPSRSVKSVPNPSLKNFKVQHGLLFTSTPLESLEA